MRIIFICGSLEPGKDGVGDYTRILATEIIKQGNNAKIISLYDKNCSVITTQNQMVKHKIQISVQRFPLLCPNKHKVDGLERAVKEFKPDWISLQFVPYAFHPKGMPVKLAKMLENIRGDFRWHIMFHELWIGKSTKFSLKPYIVRELQKFIVTQLITRLQPKVVHTQLPDFFEKLTKAGTNPKELMLFSNIPNLIHANTSQSSQILKIGFFSQYSYKQVLADFLRTLCNKEIKNGKQIEIIFIGGDEKKGKTVANEYKQNLQFACHFSVTGRLSPDNLSDVLRSCDIGITPIPRHALGKSGSLAAFISHGVPVAAPVSSEEYNGKVGFFAKDIINSILTEPDLFLPDVYRKLAAKAAELIQPDIICRTFLNDLKTSELNKKNEN